MKEFHISYGTLIEEMGEYPEMYADLLKLQLAQGQLERERKTIDENVDPTDPWDQQRLQRRSQESKANIARARATYGMK